MHTQDTPPKISVIIPCYNRKKHIKECINSVLASSIKDIEVICVDDGSTDGTMELLEKITKKDPRMSLVKARHLGAYSARWLGLNHARGEYIHFMDSDDLIEPSAYEDLYATAKENDLDQLVFTAESFNAEKHTPSEEKVKDGFDKHYHLAEECCGKIMTGKELFESLCRNKSFFVGFPMRLLKRSMVLFDGIPQCSAMWHADNFYTVVWMYWSKRAMAIDRKFYKRRVHRASITMKKDEEEVHFTSILSVIFAFAQFKDFMEDGTKPGTPEYDYVFRLIRGLNKRRNKIAKTDLPKLIRNVVWAQEREIEIHDFIMLCFIQLMERFLK